MKETWTGSEVIRHLAEIYQQLYLRPEAESPAAYRDIVARGADAEIKDLSHFITSSSDSCIWEETPAGPVRVITLHRRADFELFLQIMAHKCTLREIHPTQGASILDGVINWVTIENHHQAFLREAAEKGESTPDWNTEFNRFTSDKRNYRDALIILSTGPYSSIPAVSVGLAEEEWFRLSYIIRKAHECTHFICRRLYHEKIDPVWDELVADAVGLLAAFGSYNPELAELFLGIKDGVYLDGRLQIYASPEDLESTARRIHAVLPVLRQESECLPAGASPYELALRLEEKKDSLW